MLLFNCSIVQPFIDCFHLRLEAPEVPALVSGFQLDWVIRLIDGNWMKLKLSRRSPSSSTIGWKLAFMTNRLARLARKNILLRVIPTMTFIRFVLSLCSSRLSGKSSFWQFYPAYLLAHFLPIYVAYLLVSDLALYLAYLLALTGISSGISSDILSGILSGKSSGILSGKHSNIQTFWHFIWHTLWHSIWHIRTHSIWQTFWHFIWHSIWHIFWHSIWHAIWRSIWHIFWHSIWPLRSSGAH